MSKKIILHSIASGIFMIVVPLSVLAGELNLKSNLICQLDYMQMCEQNDHTCDWADIIQDEDEKQILYIYQKKMEITLYEGKNKIFYSKIRAKNQLNTQLVIHGINNNSPIANEGAGWLMKIYKTSGILSIAILGDATGYFIFGKCNNLK